jgi:uncharacterized membrane protein
MTRWLERLPGPALGRAVRVVLVIVGLSPFFPPFLAHVPVLGALARVFEAWFEFQCHREPARSFSVLSHVLPVCSRCFGIYAGLGLGALLARPRLGIWPLRIWVGVAALAMILDVATEHYGLRPESALLRLFTGLLLSYPVGAALVWSARGESDATDPNAGAKRPT